MSDTSRAIAATARRLEKVLALRPVLWVGAGASVAAGHPGTWQLTEKMIAGADDTIDPGLSFEQVADAYVKSEGKGALTDLLQSLVGGSHPLSALHRAIARRAAGSAFAAIVTTNYDDLLECALGEAGVRFVHQSLEDNAVVVDPEADVRLLKLHGSRDAWRSVILSGDSYSRFTPTASSGTSSVPSITRRNSWPHSSSSKTSDARRTDNGRRRQDLP